MLIPTNPEQLEVSEILQSTGDQEKQVSSPASLPGVDVFVSEGLGVFFGCGQGRGKRNS